MYFHIQRPPHSHAHRRLGPLGSGAALGVPGYFVALILQHRKCENRQHLLLLQMCLQLLQGEPDNRCWLLILLICVLHVHLVQSLPLRGARRISLCNVLRTTGTTCFYQVHDFMATPQRKGVPRPTDAPDHWSEHRREGYGDRR